MRILNSTIPKTAMFGTQQDAHDVSKIEVLASDFVDAVERAAKPNG